MANKVKIKTVGELKKLIKDLPDWAEFQVSFDGENIKRETVVEADQGTSWISPYVLITEC